MKLIVTPTNPSAECAALAYAVWAYLHRCCQRLGPAKITCSGELTADFIGESEVTAAPVTLASSLWRVASRMPDGRRLICFVSVQVGDTPVETDEASAFEYLSLWPRELLFLKVVGAQELHWKTPEEALAYLDGNQFPEAL